MEALTPVPLARLSRLVNGRRKRKGCRGRGCIVIKRKLFLTERYGRPCRKGRVNFKESDGC